MLTKLQGFVAACAALLVAGIFLPITGVAANTVYLNNGRSVAFKLIVWDDAAKEYKLQPAEGGAAVVPVALKDIDRIDVERPSDLAKAQQSINDGHPELALPVLQNIASRYKMLVWDNRARELMAKIYVQKKDGKMAVTVLNELFANPSPKGITFAARLLYWDAQALTGDNAALRKDLDDAIATGPREVAAAAQVKRGDMLRAEGVKEEALLDYVRTILFFEDAKDARAEALYKAAELFEEKQDPQAAELRKVLVQDYPENEFAKKLAGKL